MSNQLAVSITASVLAMASFALLSPASPDLRLGAAQQGWNAAAQSPAHGTPATLPSLLTG